MQSSTDNSRMAISPESGSRSEAIPQREPWVQPRLECFGDVRQVTMGGTVGINESGNVNRFP